MRRVLFATGVSICRPAVETIDFFRPATDAMMARGKGEELGVLVSRGRVGERLIRKDLGKVK